MSKAFYSKVVSYCVVLCCLLNVTSYGQDIVRIRTRSLTGNLPDPGLAGLNIQPGSEFFCGGTMINVPFEVENIGNGRLLSDNVFMAEISEPDGNFLPENSPNRRLFGMVPGRTSGTIYAKLPNNLPFGVNYRVRVVANRPRLTTTVESVPNQTDSTRNYNLVVLPKPCFSAETKAINCYSNLTVRINPACSFGRCNCPGTNPNWPIIDQGYYNVDLVDYPVQPGDVSFDYNSFTYTFRNLPTGWYQIRVRDRFSCDSTLNFYHVSSPAAPITSILINNITHNQVDLSWTDINNTIPNNAGTSYDLRYRVVEETYPDTTSPRFPNPSVHANWTQINNIGTNSVTLFPLQPNTRYEVQVRSVCYDPNTQRAESNWSASKFISTNQIPTPVDQNCRKLGGLYVRYTNTSNGSLVNNGRVFWNLDPNGQATCYELQYGPVYNDDNDPQRVALDWTHPSYVGRHFANNQRFLLPSQVTPGVPMVTKPEYKPGQLMRVRVRGNCSLRCAESQMNLSEWSNTIFFRLPLPRVGEVFGSSDIAVYPNPNQGLFNVSLMANTESTATVIVSDLVGKVVYSQVENLTAGDNNLTIDLAGQNSGIYMLKVIQGEQVNTVKVVVE